MGIVYSPRTDGTDVLVICSTCTPTLIVFIILTNGFLYFFFFISYRKRKNQKLLDVFHRQMEARPYGHD